MSLFVNCTSVESTSIDLSGLGIIAGDLIMIVAWRTGSTTMATIPSGWIANPITVNAATNTACVIGWKVAAGSDVSGTWTNASMLVAIVWRHSTNYLIVGGVNSVPIGDASTLVRFTSLSSYSANLATPTSRMNGASSYVTNIICCKVKDATIPVAFSGNTLRASHYGATLNTIFIVESNAAVSSQTQTDVTSGGASGKLCFACELLDSGVSKTSGGTSRTQHPMYQQVIG